MTGIDVARQAQRQNGGVGQTRLVHDLVQVGRVDHQHISKVVISGPGYNTGTPVRSSQTSPAQPACAVGYSRSADRGTPISTATASTKTSACNSSRYDSSTSGVCPMPASTCARRPAWRAKNSAQPCSSGAHSANCDQI